MPARPAARSRRPARLLPVAAICLIALTGLVACGASSEPPVAASERPAAPQPTGRLSAAEYRTLSAALGAADRVSKLKPRDAVGRMAAVCSRVGTPPTGLLLAVRADCRGTAALFRALAAFKPRAIYCKRTSRPGDVSCVVAIFTRFEQLAGSESSTSRAVNAQLERRGIGGRCATVIGTRRGDIVALGTLRDASADAASALSSLDQPDYTLALGRFTHSLKRLARHDTKGSQRRALRACPHG